MTFFSHLSQSFTGWWAQWQQRQRQRRQARLDKRIERTRRELQKQALAQHRAREAHRRGDPL